MRKLIYFAITFVICYILGLWRIWLGFVPALLAMMLLKTESSLLWEIPLAVLSCNVLEIAFADDVKLLLHILILCSTVIISIISPRRLVIFFLIAALAMFFENIHSIAAVWATLWFGVRTILSHFTTKQTNLQGYKL